jgi:hypothetical protein
MKKELLVILFTLGLFGVAFRPLQQDIPPRPSIRIDAGVAGQIDDEPIYSYCWPAAQNNNQCNFSTQLTPQLALDVTPEAVITVMIDGGPGNPSTLTATLSNATNVTTYNLEPSAQSIFDQANPLPQGENILQIDAVYENVAGKRAYISYRFRLNVFTPSAGTVPTEVALLPTEDATEAATAEATAEATLELETATAEATDEATAEATVLATEDVADLIPTVEVLETAEATLEATEELPTQEATEEATASPSPTFTATTEPPTATATTDLMGTSTALALTAQAGATQEAVETEETEVAVVPTDTAEPPTVTSTLVPSVTLNLTATVDAIIAQLSTATAASLAETQRAPSSTNTVEVQPTDTLTLAPTLTIEGPVTATSTPSATFTAQVAETQTTVPIATDTIVAGDLGISSEDAEAALFALLQGDAQTANQFICPEQQTDPSQITNQPLPDNMSVGVTCEPEGDLMRCDLSVVIEIEGIDSPIEVAEVLRLPVVNGQLCGDDLSANAVSVLDSAQDVESTPGAPGTTPTLVPTETLEPGATARPTSTTVPLQEVEQPATPTATSVAPPDAAPELQLVYAGQSFAPSGLSFCTAAECVDMPLTQGQPVTLTAGTAAQMRLVDSPRPEQVEIAFLNTSTLEVVQSLTRSGDRLILFNVEAAPGTYFLRVSAAWQGSTATYFFQVRVTG